VATGSGTAADAFERARRATEGKRRGGGRLGAAWGRERCGEGGAGVQGRMS
jgi:hypothetical protein